MNKLFSLTDDELVRMYIDGDNRAFDVLIDRYKDKLFSYVYHIVKDEELANDIFQETFIKAITTINSGRYAANGKFAAWITRIAHNLIIDYYRQEKSMAQVSCDNEGVDILNKKELSEETVEDSIVRHQILSDVKKLVKSLPESQQQMFKWRLAQQLRENAQKAGNMADMADTIGALEAEYNYTPFKKAYEGSLKKLMEQEIKKASAENIIGAGRTIAKLFEAYRGGAEDNPQVSLGKVLSPERGIFTAEEIELIKGKFAAMGLGLNMESTMRELPPEYMTYMYQALQPHEAKLAGEELKETLNSPDMNTKERKDSIKEAVGGAFELVRNVTGDMEAKGIRGLRAPNRGSITPTLSAQYLPDIMKQPRQQRPSNNYERGGRE